MSGRHTHRMNEGDSVADDRRSSLDDLELIVEGKKVKANTGLLSYNSSVFATLIANARAMRDENDETEFGALSKRNERPEKLKLEMPNLNYKDVKTMVGCLQSSGLVKVEMTGTKALRILPLVEQFRMSRLKKACGKALCDSLVTKQKDLGTGNLPSRDVLQILAAADTYNFNNVRKLCVEELAVNSEAANRRYIVQDKHISDKTKLKILDKMCNKKEEDYEEKLKQLRLDMDKRCREIERRRDEFMEQLKTWKTDLRQEVDDMMKNNKKVHEQLVKDLEQKKITDRIDETLKETKDSLFEEMQQLKEEINIVIETMETREIIDDMEATSLRETLKETQEFSQRQIERIADKFKTKMEDKLRACSAKEVMERFSSGYCLEENICRTIQELEDKVQTLAVSQVRYEEEKNAHEKTNAELVKLRIKEHGINTWLKWAKPAVEDEEKCMCFRHFNARK